MTLLVFEHVGRHHRRGAQERVVLRDVCFELHPGELVAVWGMRRCGRSTLLRIAAGIEPYDAGAVRFAGRALTAGANALGGDVGYCRRGLRGGERGAVLEELLVAQLARGVRWGTARANALHALEQVSAIHCAGLSLAELDGAEAMRVALARALTHAPSLLIVDDPIRDVEMGQREAILALLRSLADAGTAVLISADDARGLSGADRALSLSRGTLRGEEPELAPVVPLRRAVNG